MIQINTKQEDTEQYYSKFSLAFNKSVDDFIEYCKLYKQWEDCADADGEEKVYRHFSKIQDNLFNNVFTYPTNIIENMAMQLPLRCLLIQGLQLGFYTRLIKGYIKNESRRNVCDLYNLVNIQPSDITIKDYGVFTYLLSKYFKYGKHPLDFKIASIFRLILSGKFSCACGDCNLYIHYDKD